MVGADLDASARFLHGHLDVFELLPRVGIRRALGLAERFDANLRAGAGRHDDIARDVVQEQAAIGAHLERPRLPLAVDFDPASPLRVTSAVALGLCPVPFARLLGPLLRLLAIALRLFLRALTIAVGLLLRSLAVALGLFADPLAIAFRLLVDALSLARPGRAGGGGGAGAAIP